MEASGAPSLRRYAELTVRVGANVQRGQMLEVTAWLRAAGVNVSTIHIDFMVGGPEVDVDGVTREGDRRPLLHGGTWVFE